MKSNPNAELSALIKQYITKREAINGGEINSLDQLNGWVGEFMEGYNSRKVDDFEGYSPIEMEKIIYNLWEDGCPIKLRQLTEENFEQIPIFRQFRHLIEILQQDGKIKLTATDALPVKIVTELYKDGISVWFLDRQIEERGKIRCEAECWPVLILHNLAKKIKIVKVQRGVMTLTKRGEKLAKDYQSLLEELIIYFTTKADLSLWGRIESNQAAILGNGYSLVLLSKYGNEERSYRFYAEKYFDAFPTLMNDFYPQYSSSKEENAAKCYEHRTMNIYLRSFGLIEYKEVGKLNDPNRDIIIKKTPLFDHFIEVIKPRH